ncbi:hypothetical protein SAMN03159407_2024 [Rhizobium sp. NFR12]|nr:hypothetical protein SAMN03159407_2024 [Rhizobium sp. NFR12]
MDVGQATRWVKLIVPMLRQDVETAVLSHEVMEAQNAVIPPGLKGHRTDFVNTYGAIQNALVLKLAMDVARVFDFSVGRPIERQDMASIPVLAMLFRTGSVKETLVENASQWLSGVEWAGAEDGDRTADLQDIALELEEDHRLADGDACRSAINDFLVVNDRVSDVGSEEGLALARVRAFRNRRLAHSLFNKEPDEYPRYSDLTMLLELAKKAAALSSLAVEGLNVNFEEQTSRNRQNAEGFAARVLDGLKRSPD